jgi:general stress protein YciG
MAMADRGFGSMRKDKQREIASKGGRAAQRKGTAHKWTSDAAKEAGRKGGVVAAQRRKERKDAEQLRDEEPF